MTDAAWERECAVRKARERREQHQQHPRMASKERWLLIDRRHPKSNYLKESS